MNWREDMNDPEHAHPETGLPFDETVALRRLLEVRSKGPFLTAGEFRAEIDAMLARKRRELGIYANRSAIRRFNRRQRSTSFPTSSGTVG